jgi:CheY-like chemotaxis protein
MKPRLITDDIVFLVVDDFETMRKVTMNQLRLMGANNIHTCCNGLEAMQLLRNHKVDVILSDWNMPLMSGIDLLRAVRKDPKTSNIPFIMITAEAERIRIDDAIRSGVTSFLIKPYSATNLSFRIESALAAKHSNTRIPAAEPTGQVIPLPGIGATNTSGANNPILQTILVIDDSPDNLLLMTSLFKDEYRVLVGNSGATALKMCQSENPPDLVLLDVMMPGMDGFEVARLMRENPLSHDIPVIFVTAMTEKSASLQGFGLGAVDFVTKPIDPEILKPRVCNFMRYVGLRKQVQLACDNAVELARLQEDVENMTRHDMKGTLAGIIGLVQLLEAEKSLERSQIKQLQSIEESSLHLLGMINLSAELFKIESDRFILNAQPVKINEILRRIVEIARTAFSARHITIFMNADPSVAEGVESALGDGMLCYSLFQNLLQNACEASPDDGNVVVELRDEIPLRITFENRGVVPHSIRDRFFEKFVTFGKPGGSGVGTYSAKLLAEAQNGTISVAVSDELNSTLLTVTLPRMPQV